MALEDFLAGLAGLFGSAAEAGSSAVDFIDPELLALGVDPAEIADFAHVSGNTFAVPGLERLFSGATTDFSSDIADPGIVAGMSVPDGAGGFRTISASEASLLGRLGRLIPTGRDGGGGNIGIPKVEINETPPIPTVPRINTAQPQTPILPTPPAPIEFKPVPSEPRPQTPVGLDRLMPQRAMGDLFYNPRVQLAQDQYRQRQREGY